MGHQSFLVVGRRATDRPNVIALEPRAWANCGIVGCAKVALEKLFGWQYLAYPSSHHIPDLIPGPVDVFHLHNLHSGYFDLSVLPALSRSAPTGLTLHDLWLRSGHCAHSLGCDRWRTGCGRCPDLTLYPSIPADGTRVNLWRKQFYLRRSRLWITAPSRWILSELDESYLRGLPRRLIYNGVDLEVFKPGPKDEIRAMLGLPQGRPIVLFTATRGLENPYKDGPTLIAALRLLTQDFPHAERPLLLVLGGASDLSGPEQLSVPFTEDERLIAAYYRASDVLAYASRADNCPLVVLEAMASGLPIVASAVGGIPELVGDGDTGFLVAVGDVRALRDGLRRILVDPELAERMAVRARMRAVGNFDLTDQAAATVEWYREIRAEWQQAARSGSVPPALPRVSPAARETASDGRHE